MATFQFLNSPVWQLAAVLYSANFVTKNMALESDILQFESLIHNLFSINHISVPSYIKLSTCL